MYIVPLLGSVHQLLYMNKYVTTCKLWKCWTILETIEYDVICFVIIYLYLHCRDFVRLIKWKRYIHIVLFCFIVCKLCS